MGGVPVVGESQLVLTPTITLNCATNARRMKWPKVSQTTFLKLMRLTLTVHDTNDKIEVAAPTFPAVCAALLMELDNLYGTVHSNVFEGFKQFNEDGGDSYTHTDISLPEENFTLELTN